MQVDCEVGEVNAQGLRGVHAKRDMQLHQVAVKLPRVMAITLKEWNKTSEVWDWVSLRQIMSTGCVTPPSGELYCRPRFRPAPHGMMQTLRLNSFLELWTLLNSSMYCFRHMLGGYTMTQHPEMRCALGSKLAIRVACAAV